MFLKYIFITFRGGICGAIKKSGGFKIGKMTSSVMICSCQNMTLSTMLVLKLHEVSLYIFISGFISTIILQFFFLLYTALHSYLIFFTKSEHKNV